jgi:hypothetical protein
MERKWNRLAVSLTIATAAICAIAAGLPAAESDATQDRPQKRLSVILTFSSDATVMADRLGPDGDMANVCVRSPTGFVGTVLADSGRWASHDGSLDIQLQACRFQTYAQATSLSLATAEMIGYRLPEQVPVCYIALDGVAVVAISAPSVSVVDGALRFEDARVVRLRDAETADASPLGDLELRPDTILDMLKSLGPAEEATVPAD